MKRTVVRDVLALSASLCLVTACEPVDNGGGGGDQDATTADTSSAVDTDGADTDTGGLDVDTTDTTGDGIPVQSGDPHQIALPDDTPFVVSHPLIYDGKLYVHTSSIYDAVMSGQLGTATERLSCYDLETYQTVWSTVLTTGSSISPVILGEEGMALQRYGDEIPVWSFDHEREALDMTVVDVFTGEIRRVVEVPLEWSFRDPRGNWQRRSASRQAGVPAQHGREMIFAAGASVSLCSGEVAWDNGAWTLGVSLPITHGGRLYVRDPGGGVEVSAFDLSLARAELTGFAPDGSARLFTTEETSGVDGPPNQVLWNGTIVSVRAHSGDEVLEQGRYVERWSMDDGSLVERIRIPEDLGFGAMSGVVLAQNTLEGVMMMSGDLLLIPFWGAFPTEGSFNAGVIAMNLATGALQHAVTWDGNVGHFAPSADYLYGLDAPDNRGGFSVVQYDLLTGEPVARFSDPAYNSPDLPTPVRRAGTAMAMPRPPLHADGQLVVVADTTEASAVWVIETGDESADVRQFLMNNQLNPVLNLDDPDANTAPSPDPIERPDPEDTSVDETSTLPPEPEGDGVDTPPGAEPDEAVLAALGATAADLETWPRSYVAMLRDVEYSNDGDEGGNIGEGYLRVETEYSRVNGVCSREGVSRTRYPASDFIGLWDPVHAYMNPDLPVFFGTEELLERSEGQLVLRYSALEDDTPDGWFDTFLVWAGRALEIAWGVVTGDYCAVAEATLAAVEQEASDYTDHFGAALAQIGPGDDDAIPNLYGIPDGLWSAEVPVAGSTSRSVLAAAQDAVGAVCGVLDVLDGDIFALENVATSAIDLFDPEEMSTRAHFDLELHRPLRVSHLTVSVDASDLAPPMDWTLGAHVSLLGVDPLDDTPDHPVSADGTPFIARFEVPSQDIAELPTLVDIALDTDDERVGTTGVYLELTAGFEIGMGWLGGPVFSTTRFFDDALYGAWEPTEDAQVFRKEVTYIIDARTVSGPLTLVYEIELES